MVLPFPLLKGRTTQAIERERIKATKEPQLVFSDPYVGNMETNQEKIIFEIYSAAFALAPAQRSTFLNHRCEDRPETRKKVDELLELAESQGPDDSFGQRLHQLVEQQVVDVNGGRRDFQPLQPGRFFQHFHILEKLGEGGMGVVYRALDTRLKRLVAIKVASRRRLHALDTDKRLLMEALAVGRLSHPNVVTLYSVEETEHEFLLVMEYLEGDTLRALLDGRPWQLERFFDTARQIAEGMAAAHREGLVHRDLKPGNIMISRDGQAKVLDFGLAKFSTPKEGISMEETLCRTTQPHVLRGTLPYMAPEQIRADRVSPATDVYALGVVFFEMLTGKRPFAGQNPADLVAAILKEPAPGLNGRGFKFPRELRSLITRCLRKEARSRPGHAGEVHEALCRLARKPRAKLVWGRSWYFGAALLLFLIWAALAVKKTWPWRLLDGSSRLETSEALLLDDPGPDRTASPQILGTLRSVHIENALPWFERWLQELVYHGMNQSRNVRLVVPAKGVTPRFRLSIMGENLGAAGYDLRLRLEDHRESNERQFPISGPDIELLPQRLNRALRAAIVGFDPSFQAKPWRPSGLGDEDSPQFFFRGVVLFEDGREAEALALFEQAHEHAPDFGWATFRLSLTLSALGKKTEAWRLADRLNEGGPWNGLERATFLGHFYMLNLNYREARDAFKKWEMLGHYSGDVFRQLVHCESEIGNLPGAICWARRAGALDPGDVHNFSQLCFVLVEAGKFDLALREAERAESRFGENAQILWAKTLALLGKRDSGAALDHIRRLEGLSSGVPFYQSIVSRLRATEAMVRGDWPAAIEPLESVLALHALERLADLQDHNYLWLARLYWLSGDRKRAMGYLAELQAQELEPIPPHLRVLRRSALLYAEMGAWSELGVLQERLEKIAADYPSQISTSSPYLVEGVALLTRALELPGSERNRVLQAAEGKLRQARRTWVDVWLQWYLGRVYAAMGRPEAAVYFADVAGSRRGQLLYRAFPAHWWLASN